MKIGRTILLAATVTGAALFLLPIASGQTEPAGTWSATGVLLESCTCAVPCTCNFGEGPSPNHYCHAVYAYKLEKARWEGIDLSGLVVGGADGPKGSAGYLDSRATPAQKPALEKLTYALFRQGGPSGGARKFVSLPIMHEVKGNDLKLNYPGRGGFTAKLIIGRDGKSPVVVENNTIWPIQRAVKGKARLSYKDTATGEITGDGVNANYGTFSLQGRTSE